MLDSAASRTNLASPMLSFDEEPDPEVPDPDPDIPDCEPVEPEDPEPDCEPVVLDPEVVPWFRAKAGARARRPVRPIRAMRWMFLLIVVPLSPKSCIRQGNATEQGPS